MAAGLVPRFRTLLEQAVLAAQDSPESPDWAGLETLIEESSLTERAFLLRQVCDTCAPRVISGPGLLSAVAALRRLVYGVVSDLGLAAFPSCDGQPMDTFPKTKRRKRTLPGQHLGPAIKSFANETARENHHPNDLSAETDEIRPVHCDHSETVVSNDELASPASEGSWPVSGEVVLRWLAQATDLSFHERWLVPPDEWLNLIRESPAVPRVKNHIARRAVSLLRDIHYWSPPLVASWQPLLILCGAQRPLRLEALGCLMARSRPEMPPSVLDLSLRRDVCYAKELLRMALVPEQPHRVWHQEMGATLFLLIAGMPSIQASCRQAFLRKVREYFVDSMEALLTTFPFPGQRQPMSPVEMCMTLARGRETFLATALDLVAACLDENVTWPVADWSLFSAEQAPKGSLRNLLALEILEKMAAAPALRLQKESWLQFLAASSASQPLAFLTERARQLLKDRVLCSASVPVLHHVLRHCSELVDAVIYQCRKTLFQASDAKQAHAAQALASLAALLSDLHQHQNLDVGPFARQFSLRCAPDNLSREISRLSLRILENGSMVTRRAWYETTIRVAETWTLPRIVLDLVRAHIRQTFFTSPWSPHESAEAIPLRLGQHWIEDDLPSLLCILGVGRDGGIFAECINRLSRMDLSHFDIPEQTADEPLDETDRRMLLTLLDTIEVAMLFWWPAHHQTAQYLSSPRMEITSTIPSVAVNSSQQVGEGKAAVMDICEASLRSPIEPFYVSSIGDKANDGDVTQAVIPGSSPAGMSVDVPSTETDFGQVSTQPMPRRLRQCQEQRFQSDSDTEQPRGVSLTSPGGRERSMVFEAPISPDAATLSMLQLHAQIEQRLGDPLMIWRSIHHNPLRIGSETGTEAVRQKTNDSLPKSKHKNSTHWKNEPLIGEYVVAKPPCADRIPVRALREALASLTERICDDTATPEVLSLAKIALRRLLVARESAALISAKNHLESVLLELSDATIVRPNAETIYLLAILALYVLQRAASLKASTSAGAHCGPNAEQPLTDNARLLALCRCAARALLRGLQTEEWSCCLAGALLLDALGPQAAVVATSELAALRWDAPFWDRVRRCLSVSKRASIHPGIRCLLPICHDVRLLFRAALRASILPASWYRQQPITTLALQIVSTWGATTGPDWNVMRLFVLQMQTWLQHFDWLVDRGCRFCAPLTEPKMISSHLASVWTDWARALAMTAVIACGNGVENGSHLAPQVPHAASTASEVPNLVACVPRVTAVAPWAFIRALARAKTLGFQSLTRLARAVLQKRLALCRSSWKKLVWVASQELATSAYDVLTAASEPTADETSAKIRAESQLFPQMIYALEQADKSLLAVSDAYHDQRLVHRMRRPVARDFKLAINRG
jgi:hypothetical protein